MADEVLAGLVEGQTAKPQAPYMLGYLRKEPGRYEDAVGHFRRAITLDSLYLSAWRQLRELGDKTYIEGDERDTARLRVFELDPRQRHVRYRLDEVADLAALWRAIARFAAERAGQSEGEPLYPLAGRVRARREALGRLPTDRRSQPEQYIGTQDKMAGPVRDGQAAPSLANHQLLIATLRMMGAATGADGLE